MATSVQNDTANIIGRVKGIFHSGGNPRTLLPLAHNSKWNIVRTWAPGSPMVDDFWLQAIRFNEKRVMDYRPTVIQAGEKESAAHFWQGSHSAEGLRLKVIKTQAHARAIR